VQQRGGAAAQLCGSASNERWIFYDQTYIDRIKPDPEKSDLPRYFVLAHEVAHHINGDTLLGNDWSKDQELAADYAAATWLTRLGVSEDHLLRAFDSLGFPIEATNGYPSREERRRRVVNGCRDAQRGLIQARRIQTEAGQALKKIESSRPALGPRLGQERTKVQLGARPGDEHINPLDGLTYVWIPPGSFTMGCSPNDEECDDVEKPAHTVAITKGFWIGKSEVPQAAYQKVTGTNPSYFRGLNRPVEQVTWTDAESFCQEIGGRLPTEAEWEYAARGGSAAPRHSDLERIAWYRGNSGNETNDIMTKAKNAFGLHDMIGNVWEWVVDWYAPYSTSAATDPRGPATGDTKVARGGSWDLFQQVARVSFRYRNQLSSRSYNIGLRCAGEFR